RLRPVVAIERIVNGRGEQISARVDNGQAFVAGPPLEFAGDLCSAMVEEFRLGQQGQLVSRLSTLLGTLDDARSFLREVRKLVATVPDDISLPWLQEHGLSIEGPLHTAFTEQMDGRLAPLPGLPPHPVGPPASDDEPDRVGTAPTSDGEAE